MKLELPSKRTGQAKALLWPATLALLLLAAASCGGNTESPPGLFSTPADSASGSPAPTPTPNGGPASDGSTSPEADNNVGQGAPALSSTPTDSVSGSPAPTPTSGPVSDGSTSPEAGNKVGQRAPEFTLTFSDAEPVTLASLREQGKPVVLYFFTTW